MLKILWKRGEIAPEDQFHPLSTIFYYLMLNFYVKTGIRFSLRDKQLFEITEVELTGVDCIFLCISMAQTYDPWSEAILDSETFHSNKLGRGPLGNATYQISNIWAMWF